jgi:hypothetical protein
MTKTKHVTARISAELYARLPEKGKNAFINEAIRNQLDSSHNAGKEFNSMKRKINSLDIDSLLQAINDLNITTQIIFEEQRKENEVIKLTHRRASLASGFAGQILDELTKSNVLRLSKHKEFTSTIDAEILKLKF